MLDDLKYIQQVDKSDALGFTAKQIEQLRHSFSVGPLNFTPQNIVFSGMGGSSLVAELVHTWPRVAVPFVVSKGYDLPNWVDEKTLVICASYSGNTEETLSALQQARDRAGHIVVLAHGGMLHEEAKAHDVQFVQLPPAQQPRTAVFYAYRAVVEILVAAGVVEGTKIAELEAAVDSLQKSCAEWGPEVAESKNYAKQLARVMVGKTPIVYGGALTYPAAYKWKIDVNENAKNTAWCNQLPEFNHNEFLGWSSHPVEKPFAVIDLISSFEHERILKRFDVTDRMLSGRRPKAIRVEAVGESVLEQLLYLVLLGDYATTYLAVLNNVDPAPVDLVEKFKKELDA
ncbi:MAG TPA: bifunctional phosphoglucose/phosphomannose isomerase [Candidatus Saccharibacteria bacterium]|jgi:glucose/mannose-6-phosphate isomerase|nr:Bifunctional phosphoglucose/phosphomannose isomerase [Patescibacteria group bacterium]HMS31184.1 bifunctional phosphoglucose/phosphomannose isomerase [Candidatus Saccharibacteria bacterium]